jgi:hypothetical protein
MLVQDVRDARCLPVAQQVAQIRTARSFALDERGRITDGLLLRMDLGDVGFHRRRCRLKVAHGMVGEGGRVRLPCVDRVRHQAAHGRLEVVVTNDTTRDAGSAGADCRLVEDDDIRTGAGRGGLQESGQVPRGGKSVHTRAHHDDATARRDGARLRMRHLGSLSLSWCVHSLVLPYRQHHCRMTI